MNAARRKRESDEIKTEILGIINFGEETGTIYKKTAIANKCGINYILATKIIDELESDKIVKRNQDGFYELTQLGKDNAKQLALSTEDRIKIAKLAENVANMSPNANHGRNVCIFCGRNLQETAPTQHSPNCAWKQLNVIFKKVKA